MPSGERSRCPPSRYTDVGVRLLSIGGMCMSATKLPVLLESGDHLSREEFHRRYCERPDIRKAELIQGVVYVASPVRYTFHSRQQRLILHWLSEYVLRHPGLECGGEATLLLDAENEVQPDAFLLAQ